MDSKQTDNGATETLYCICRQPWDESNPVFMIQCSQCSEWFHGLCVETDEVSSTKYETWHCPNCALYHGPSRLKKGLRNRKRMDFSILNESPEEGGRDLVDIDYASRLRSRTKSKLFAKASGCLTKLTGEEFTSQYANEHGFYKPVLVPMATPELGLEVPNKSFSIAQIAKLTGEYRMLQVIDASTQITFEYSLKEWNEYMAIPPHKRDRILNVISFEFSETPLNDLVHAPKFVRDLDLVTLHWRNEKTRPRVGKYCLMSSQGSYTDFHVDFGGTSVWYHVFKGEKVFYFIEPTRHNLKIYADWAVSGDKQSQQFLGDLVSNCYVVPVKKGQTLFIPSGWIHAVFTPKDSLVFGGNFVHVHLLEMQLSIYSLEKRIKVQKAFRFPNFEMLMWFVACDFMKKNLADIKVQPRHVLQGYNALSRVLIKWAKSPLRRHQEQFPSGINVLDVATSLEGLMNQCVCELQSKTKPVSKKREGETKLNSKSKTMKKGRGVLTQGKGGASHTALTMKDSVKVDKTKVKEELLPAKVPAQDESQARGSSGEIVDIFWAQCDKCKEWREVPEDMCGEGSSFSCQDVKETCTMKPTLWAQCYKCREWHIVSDAPDAASNYLCSDVGKKCLEQK